MTLVMTAPHFLGCPRPTAKIPPFTLTGYEENYVAQAKMNGAYNYIIISPYKAMTCFNRHGLAHKRWQPSEEFKDTFRILNGGWYVFCAELLNDKTPHIKDVNYIHDVLVVDSVLQIGKTYPERHKILTELFPQVIPEATYDMVYPKTTTHYVYDSKTWIASIIEDNFIGNYRRLTNSPEVEGLVLKHRSKQLRLDDMSEGQIKCRKPTKNYGF